MVLVSCAGVASTSMFPALWREHRTDSTSDRSGSAVVADPEAEPFDVAGHEADAAEEIGARCGVRRSVELLKTFLTPFSQIILPFVFCLLRWRC